MNSTRLIKARDGIISVEMEKCALKESVEPEFIRKGIANGNIVVVRNVKHKAIDPLAIGKGIRTKINVNIGTSTDCIDINEELEKLNIAIKNGADTVMDLSTGGNIDEIRKEIIKNSTIPVGTVPIYQAVIETFKKNKNIGDLKISDLFRIIEKQAEDGVDFMTLHCGVTRESVERLNKEGRLLDVVSRGGAFLIEWMRYNNKENPLFEEFDTLINIAKEYDIVLSLGDGLRPGCLADATDRGQIQELIILGELTERSWNEGVQVMIEGPGHIPINEIESNILLEKKICHEAPFYVLGPIVTDIAPGYDHITSAIGGAIAAAYGADFLCYVTPSEHLGLPTVEDVKVGVIASKIAAHAADIAKNVRGAIERDIEMAKYRKNLDWDGQIKASIDPERAIKYKEERSSPNSDVCTMCSEYCAIKIIKNGI
jgi:phosphomethylpyrimidine synthase